MARYVIGYVPGGAYANGISYLELSDTMHIRGYGHASCSTSDEALTWLFDEQKVSPNDVICAGIDTLMSWATVGTFRPMDYFLKQEYPEVENLIFSVNSAYGAMAIHGMVFAHALIRCAPHIHFINESHPKVAYYAQTGFWHDYLTRTDQLNIDPKESHESARWTCNKMFNEVGAVRMWKELLQWINHDAGYSMVQSSDITIPIDDSEWDALYSAWFTYHLGFRSTCRDLMKLEEQGLLTINLSTDQSSRIKLLRQRFAGEDQSIVRMMENRIIIPCELEEKVKYLWLPASAGDANERFT
ncbi:hypothetical protein EHV15_35650 [Paenibacillus oralis]|uniref:Uncharacterized protein n=1 Tax=Paenibacillus oralis TaxID=2490856 RepID=A0A3P3TBL7_9BACL|nr:hypothetical protein [Paenibacillus oralis]RRJ54909.1 hypothetical protein EHV15_35650 [Paenibacillus oralis]